MQYLKSESYRFFRKIAVYQTIVISLGLVLAAIFTLYAVAKGDPQFLYGNTRHLYFTVLSCTPLIILVGLLINRQLTGSDRTVIKQSLALGMSRRSIFFSKLLVTLTVYIILCIVGLLLVTFGGEMLLTSKPVWRDQFLLSVVNIAPLMLSAFILGHTLLMVLSNEFICVFLVLFGYTGLFAQLLGLLFAVFGERDSIVNYLPGALLQAIQNKFTAKPIVFEPSYWVVGIVISVFSLVIGYWIFEKKDI